MVEEDFFLDNFGIVEMYQDHDIISLAEANFRTILIAIYFSFTSLSTVGFGDYHPRSNSERLMCALILLAGVATFSIILGNFIDILNEFKAMNEDLGDGDQLEMFFMVLKRFNGGKDLSQDFIERIEEFFDYKWCYDKNQAIDDPDELALLD